MAKTKIVKEKNLELSKLIMREIEQRSEEQLTNVEMDKVYEAIASKTGYKWYSGGKIDRLSNYPDGNKLVFVKFNGQPTTGSIWPEWAYEYAKMAFELDKTVSVLSSGLPTGNRLLMVEVE